MHVSNYKLVLNACVLWSELISSLKEHISLSLIESVTVLFGFGVFLLYCGLFGFLRYFESLNVRRS